MASESSPVEDLQSYVTIGARAPQNAWTAEDDARLVSMPFDEILDEIKAEILDAAEDSIQFDTFGLQAPFVNALRRILLSQVPSLAIDKVTIFQNTTLISDEKLASRLGLIPFKIAPRGFDYFEYGEKMTDSNTVVLRLHVKCVKRKLEDIDFESIPEASRIDERGRPVESIKNVDLNRLPQDMIWENSKVYSSDLVWIPWGDQATEFEGENEIRPVHDDILLLKLRPGQEIECECFAQKGQGRKHAKFSPVGTVTYKMFPRITFKKPVEGELAVKLKALCPMNVFDIEDLPRGKKAVVAHPNLCTVCRECIREPEWDERILLQKDKTHFRFNIESMGAYSAEELLVESLDLLKGKCGELLDSLQNIKPTKPKTSLGIDG